MSEQRRTEGKIMETMRMSAMDIAGTSVMGETQMVSALEKAGLAGWDVRKAPLWADTRELAEHQRGVPINGRYATVRTMPGGGLKPLGVVGEQYQPVQNEAHAEFLDEVVAQSGGQYAQATAFKGGSLVYISILLPEHVLVNGQDPVKMYLNGINSHDGTTHFMLNLSPERAWCANQLNYFRKNSLKFRHSGNVADKVVQAQESLGLTFDLIGKFRSDAERLAATDMSTAQFAGVVEEIFPVPEAMHKPENQLTRGERNTATRYERLREGLAETLVAPHNRPVWDTAWGGLNAVVEYLEWGHGSDKGREERIMTSEDLTRKIGKAKEAFTKFALAA